MGIPADVAEHDLAFMRGRYVTGEVPIVDRGDGRT
jgi:hypothetical protein